jgi:pheromone a factor receptor
VAVIYNTPLAYPISFMWPVVIGLVSVVYCILSLLAFRRQQVELSRFLSSNKSLTLSRYLRLMALAMAETMCTTPLGVFAIVLNATTMEVSPWRSWADTHYNYSRVELIPSLLWRQNRLLVASLELSRWAPVFCAFVFFFFFGFAEESRRNYSNLFSRILRALDITPRSTSSREKKGRLSLKSAFGSFSFSKRFPLKLDTSNSSVHTLPVFIKKDFAPSQPPSPTFTTSSVTAYSPSSTSHGVSTPTEAGFISFQLPSPPAPTMGEAPPSYAAYHRFSSTTTASVVPLDPCPYIVPFDFERLQQDREDR